MRKVIGSSATTRIEMRQLRYFVAVATEGSIRRAAQKLGVSQPPISRQIHQLEEEIGNLLFDRTATGLVLTPSGALFLSHAKDILERMQYAANITANTKSEGVKNLTVKFIDDFMYGLLPSVLKSFQDENPDVFVQCELGYTKNILAELKNGRTDVALVLAPLPVSAYSLSVYRFNALPIQAIMAKSHRLAERSTLHLTDLRGEIVSFAPVHAESGFDIEVINFFQKAGVSFPMTGEIWPPEVLIELLLRGKPGVALTTKESINFKRPDIKCIPIVDAGTVTPVAVWRGNIASQATQEFIRHCRTIDAQNPDVKLASVPAAEVKSSTKVS